MTHALYNHQKMTKNWGNMVKNLVQFAFMPESKNRNQGFPLTKSIITIFRNKQEKMLLQGKLFDCCDYLQIFLQYFLTVTQYIKNGKIVQ